MIELNCLQNHSRPKVQNTFATFLIVYSTTSIFDHVVDHFINQPFKGLSKGLSTYVPDHL